MPGHDAGEEIAIRYVRNDERLRREFDHRLAMFLTQPAPQRSDITPLVEALDQLGQRIPSLLVRLRRPTTGQGLQVALEFELPPAAAER